MTKNYSHIIILFFALLFSVPFLAQEIQSQSKNQDTMIEGLNFYPNPVSNGKIYITSKLGLEKDIVIFDVLGKKVFQTTLASKELNIANIAPGVYIIKIKENEATATRKLIIK